MRPVLVLCIACAGICSQSALAADTYFVPEVSVKAEHHTNLDLTTAPADGISGYSGLVSGVFGLRTPRSVTEVRPRIEYIDFPARDETQRTNGYLDFNSRYSYLRSSWNLIGNYRQESTFEAQRNDAEYDEFDPNDPTVETTSRTSLISKDRTRIQLRPSFNHKFTERVGAEVTALYQTVKLDSEVQDGNVEYDYLSVNGSVLWTLNPRTELGTGIYGARYDGDDNDQVSSTGLALGLRHSWSQTFSGSATLNFERTDIDSAIPGADEESNNVGVDVALVRVGQISRLRFNGGRTFIPSSAGSRTVLDQFRLQYSRNLTQRLNLLLAGRASRTRVQGVSNSDDDRDYVVGSTELSWNLTRQWYLNAGYSYSWREYRVEDDYSDDHLLTVGVRYLGMRPQ